MPSFTDYGAYDDVDSGQWGGSVSSGMPTTVPTASPDFSGFGAVLINGLPRLVDSYAGVVRAQNTMPQVYRNGRYYNVDPDAYRYGYGQGGIFGGSSLLLIALAVGAVMILKD